MYRFQGDDEVVEDSEPERVELRRKRKLEKTKKQAAAKSTMSAIDLTDAAVVILPGPSKPSHSVIEISDESLNATLFNDAPGPIFPITTGTQSGSIAWRTHDVPSCGPTPLGPHIPVLSSSAAGVHSVVASDGSEAESGRSRLNLDRFAHKAAIRASKAPPPVARPLDSAQSSSALSVSAPKKQSRSLDPPFAKGFTTTELGKLLKCVSCDVAWTVKKTAAHKMKHIRTCAKKNGLTDSTVQALIRGEVAKAAADAQADGKLNVEPANPIAADSVPKTLLEDILDEAGPKKRARRQPVVETIKSVTETRDNILARTRAVLDSSTPSAHDDLEPIATQPFGRSRFQQATNDNPGQNTRGAANEHRSSHIPTFRRQFLTTETSSSVCNEGPESLHDDSDAEPALLYSDRRMAGSASIGLAPLANSGVANRPASPTKHDNSSLLFASNVGHLSLSSSDVSQHFLLTTASKGSVEILSTPPASHSTLETPWAQETEESHGQSPQIYTYDDFEHDNDEAFLHFSPEYPSFTNSTVAKKKKRSTDRTRRASSVHSVISSSTPSTSSNESVPLAKLVRPYTRTKRKQRAPALDKSTTQPNSTELSDGDWLQRITDAIISDETLHLRVLRFEPIHFDEFMHLAAQKDLLQEPASRFRFRFTLRKVLDKLSVNFYGYAGEPGRRR